MIQVYTGNGKGKTTAALGLALRAAGAGLKVYIVQFAKGRHCSELNSLKKIKNIKVENFGRTCFVKNTPHKEDIELARMGLDRVRKILNHKIYDVLILDEACVAVRLGLLALGDVLELIKNTPRQTELVITGRYAHQKILKAADLISQIRPLKHYFKKGVKARKGIEF